MCDLEVIVIPSRLRLIHKTVVLERVLTTLDLSCEENVAPWKWNSPLVDYTFNTPVVELLKLQKSVSFL